MSRNPDYAGEIRFASIDNGLAAQAVPAAAFLEVLQNEYETGAAIPKDHHDIVIDGFQFLANQTVVDWKAVSLTAGVYLLTNLQKGLEAKRNYEYERFMQADGMEPGKESIWQRTKPKLARTAALAGAYAVGTKLNLEQDLIGAFAFGGTAAVYGLIRNRRTNFGRLGRNDI